MIFKGSGVALVTPFNAKGEVDFYKLKRLIEFQIASRTKALIILDTTGESSTITQEERHKIIKFCVGQISGRIPTIIGINSNCTQTAIIQAKEAENLGADAILVSLPYFNQSSQDGLFLHYKKIARKTKLPIIISNTPSKTGVNILPKTILKLSKLKNVVGLKDAGENIKQSMKLLELLPKNFALFSGDDTLTYPLMAMGYHGVISSAANVYPALISSLCDSLIDRNYENALRIHNFLYSLNEALAFDTSPVCIKYYISLLGNNAGNVRLPLTEPSKEIKKILQEVKQKYEN